MRVVQVSTFLVLAVVLSGLSACNRASEPAVSSASSSASTSATASAAAPAAAPAAPQAPLSAAESAALYTKYCALCHGAKAEGYAADNAPSLVSSTFLATASDAFLRTSIEQGRPGTAMAGYGKAVGGPLSAIEIDALIAFLRTDAPPRVELPAVAPNGIVGDVTRGKGIYEKSCMSCHGTAQQRGNAVHLANPALLASASPAFLRYAIEKGRPGTPMEAWEGKLNPQQIEDVLVYVKSLVLSAMPVAGAVAPGHEGHNHGPAAGAHGQALPAALPWGPIVVNPDGAAPKFKVRDDRFVSIVDVNKAFTAKNRLIFLDARPPSDWLVAHIPGALSLPHYDLSPLDKIPNDGTAIIAYCACPHHASGIVVDELRRRGYKNSYVLDEGILAWQRAGYPTYTAPGSRLPPAPPPMLVPN